LFGVDSLIRCTCLLDLIKDDNFVNTQSRFYENDSVEGYLNQIDDIVHHFFKNAYEMLNYTCPHT
jgi:hypothetical protein